ncbi:hypothetical protein JCM2421_01230 [Staphylococcus auricularis]|uniref:DUF3278 domain-containing protein n=1 Tax=Staphylococcus auricularis TaxID=29379 RepID=A0AAP8PPI5_9STAP|nr:hypothetical protein [Staphylococcus auricularis]PNZ68177.1 hypothetical protein CD158_04075 [Staphylococcus auricularis]QPT06116.1 hypothetical protein I6G39_00045 [Staphylococcus auricularis]BCU51351.1 hypothetical protein JCM2421_01230 [Staphylococcus auricularis]SQJ06408.1 Uncharacterised protein [Staphylococcus auricularis]
MDKFKQSWKKITLGIVADRDEREEQIMNSKLATLFLASYWLILLLTLISFVFDAYKHTFSTGTFLFLVLVLIESLAIMFSLKNAGVDKEVVYSKTEYKVMLKKLKLQSVIASILFVGLAFLLNIFLQFIGQTHVILANLDIFGWLIGGIFFGVLIYFLGKSKIKIEQ